MSKIHLPLRNNKPRDYDKYIKMFRDGVKRKIIVNSLIEDLGIAQKTAEQNYYTKVRVPALKQIKSEKIVDIDVIAPGKYFSEREKLRIQRAVGFR